MRCQLSSSRRRCAAALGAALVLLLAACAVAEEEKTAAQLEAEEAAKEDAADRAKGEGFEPEQPYDGRLTLGEVQEGRPDIVGVFAIDKGRAYPVKLAYANLLADLKPYNHKKVRLQGKFRNQGKYFVVTGIIPPPAAPARVRKIGGL